VGKKVAQICAEKSISKVCFDRGGFTYHGRIKVRGQGWGPAAVQAAAAAWVAMHSVHNQQIECSSRLHCCMHYAHAFEFCSGSMVPWCYASGLVRGHTCTNHGPVCCCCRLLQRLRARLAWSSEPCVWALVQPGRWLVDGSSGLFKAGVGKGKHSV
jgi:hypothetical protein